MTISWAKSKRAFVATAVLLASQTSSFAESQTEPGRTMGFGAGPVPEGFYYTNLTDYGVRGTSPDTTLGVEVTDFFWSTPWTIFGANLSIDFTPSFLFVNQGDHFAQGVFNPYLAAVFGWSLGAGWNFSYTAGGYFPIDTSVSGNFGTFEQRFGLSYLADGWNITGRFIFGLTGDNQTTDSQTSPDYLNFDFTATKKIEKLEFGLVGFASTDLNKPFATYREQSQVALGGLIGYDFGGVTIRVKGTETLAENNYGGYDTRIWTDVIVPVSAPPKPLK